MKNVTRRSFIGVGAAAGMAAVLAGCSSGSGSASSASASASASSASASASSASASASSASASAAAPSGGQLRFVTGGESGMYYAVGGVIANHATNNAGVNVSAQSSNGSKANVTDIEDGLAELGFCQADVMTYAYEGTNDFEGMPVEVFSTVGVLYDEVVQLVTTDPAIKSVEDLKGKRVSIGAANSGVYYNVLDILGAYGIDVDKDITKNLQSFQDSADSLKNGQLDAAFIVAGTPTTAITDLMTTKEAYLVSIDEEHINQLCEKMPYYAKSVIAPNTYTGQTEEVTTVAVPAVIIAADSVSEADIYAFTADIFDNLSELEGSHDKFKEMSIEKGASMKAVPYHPGAAKYFNEKGQTVTSK